ncbi:MAG TPA: hypothetical protein VFF69_12255 [Phycisphaerales bacterium]|nr:hypothetical protein [Phycisphaerales bacterium]
MSTLSGRRISDDFRYELADTARVAEMSNRPRSLLILATLLFVVAGVALVLTLRERDIAVRQFRVQTDRTGQVANLAAQFRVLEQQGAAASTGRNERIPDLFTRIEQAATGAGLREKPPIPATPDPLRSGGALKYQYTYTMQDASLEALLEWIREAQRLVPGLEVSQVEITPQPKNWKLRVVFVRWERSS